MMIRDLFIGFIIIILIGIWIVKVLKSLIEISCVTVYAVYERRQVTSLSMQFIYTIHLFIYYLSSTRIPQTIIVHVYIANYHIYLM